MGTPRNPSRLTSAGSHRLNHQIMILAIHSPCSSRSAIKHCLWMWICGWMQNPHFIRRLDTVSLCTFHFRFSFQTRISSFAIVTALVLIRFLRLLTSFRVTECSSQNYLSYLVIIFGLGSTVGFPRLHRTPADTRSLWREKITSSFIHVFGLSTLSSHCFAEGHYFISRKRLHSALMYKAFLLGPVTY
jgi:hypothetical protein